MASRELSESLIQNTKEWPLYPFMPVKMDGSLTVGFLFCDDVVESRWRVHLGPISNEAWRAKQPGPIYLPYNSLQSLLDDGWVVD